jgi:rubrerythrin
MDEKQGMEETKPFGGLQGIVPDQKTLKILSPAYAGDESELGAILLYSYQHVVLENLGYTAQADGIAKIAMDEMRHLHLLADLIYKLGALPVYTYLPPYPINYFSARTVPYGKTPRKMLLDSIEGESRAVEGYSKMLARIESEQVCAVIERIRADEMRHLQAFKRMLSEL